MKREEKNALSRQRILEAALEEFSQKGYEGASLTTVCAQKGLSKGMIYHYFKDKDQLYLLCVEKCFHDLGERLRNTAKNLQGPARQRLQDYFDARLRFLADHPLYMGIFSDVVFRPPVGLDREIAACRRGFDELNVAVLTQLLESQTLREGLQISVVVEDFRLYMDYFNAHYHAIYSGEGSGEDALQKHEERCHRQLDILLYGVLGENNAK